MPEYNFLVVIESDEPIDDLHEVGQNIVDSLRHRSDQGSLMPQDQEVRTQRIHAYNEDGTVKYAEFPPQKGDA